MDLNELIRMFILDVLADDYENLEKIYDEIHNFASRCDIAIGERDIDRELKSLIAAGLVEAYRLSPTAPPEKAFGVPPDDCLDQHYYWLTAEGLDLQRAEYPGWPFDANDRLRDDWPKLRASMARAQLRNYEAGTIRATLTNGDVIVISSLAVDQEGCSGRVLGHEAYNPEVKYWWALDEFLDVRPA